MSHVGRKRRGGGGSREEGRMPESEGERQSESDGDGLGARDEAPKEQLQELQRRCRPSPQAWFHTAQSRARHVLINTHTHTHTVRLYKKKKKKNNEERTEIDMSESQQGSKHECFQTGVISTPNNRHAVLPHHVFTATFCSALNLFP